MQISTSLWVTWYHIRLLNFSCGTKMKMTSYVPSCRLYKKTYHSFPPSQKYALFYPHSSHSAVVLSEINSGAYKKNGWTWRCVFTIPHKIMIYRVIHCILNFLINLSLWSEWSRDQRSFLRYMFPFYQSSIYQTVKVCFQKVTCSF